MSRIGWSTSSRRRTTIRRSGLSFATTSAGTGAPADITVFGYNWQWASPLYGIFILSTLARLLVVLTFIPRLKEVRAVRPISFGQVIFRVTRVNALAGLVFDIVGSRPKSDDDQ